MTRWKAAGSHLLLSVFVIGGIAVTAFLLWYPLNLYKVAGLDRLLVVMLGIDLTAGPLLTLILYRKGKWGLKFDLAIVGIAQLAFLAYGLNTLWHARPVFLVATPELFTLVFASEIDDEDLAKANRPEWRTLPWDGPKLVATRMPSDPDLRREAIEEFMNGGAGIERSPKYYFAYSEISAEILSASKPLGDTVDLRDAEVQKTERDRKSMRAVPLISRRGEGAMLLDARTGELLGAVAVKEASNQSG